MVYCRLQRIGAQGSIVIIVVDTEERIDGLLPQMEMWVSVNGGLITVQDLEGHCYLHPDLKRKGKGGKE